MLRGPLRAALPSLRDLPSETQAFLRRILWMRVDLSMMRKRSWNLSEVLTVSEFAYCLLNFATSTA